MTENELRPGDFVEITGGIHQGGIGIIVNPLGGRGHHPNVRQVFLLDDPSTLNWEIGTMQMKEFNFNPHWPSSQKKYGASASKMRRFIESLREDSHASD